MKIGLRAKLRQIRMCVSRSTEPRTRVATVAAIMLCSSRKRKGRRPLTVSAGFAKNRSSLKNRSFAAKIIPARTQAGLPLLGGGCAAETLIAHHTETISGRSRSPGHPPRRSRNTRRAGGVRGHMSSTSSWPRPFAPTSSSLIPARQRARGPAIGAIRR